MKLYLRNSWDGVTIKTYMDYLNALNDPNTDDFEKQLRILALMCGIDKSELMPLPAGQIVPLFEQLAFMKQPPTSEVRSYYDIAGKKFKLVMDVKYLTAGQFIDLSHYTKEPDLIIDNIHSICAVLLLPVKEYRGKKEPPIEKYGETPHDELSEFFYENMPIQEAIGISAFFTMLYSLFMEVTKRYLETTRTNQLNLALKMLKPASIRRMKTGSIKNGTGSRQ